MTLIQSGSKEAVSEYIATEIKAGKDPKQAAAIAYSTQRQNKDYEPMALQVAPDGMTVQDINQANRKFWKNAGGEQS